MNFSIRDSFLNLIEDTKKYLNQLDEDFHIHLSDSESSYFALDAEKTKSKIIVKPKESAPSSSVSIPKSISQKKRTNLPFLPISPTYAVKPAPQREPLIAKKATIPEKVESAPSISLFTSLEKPQKAELNYNEIKRIIKEIAPEYPLSEIIPSDKKAREIANSWQLKKHAAEVTILSFSETPQQLLFLKNLAQAIDILFMPAKIISALEIEKDNRWLQFFSENDLKLIIACDYSIWRLPQLIKFYKEIPSKHQHFLQEIPLFMLPDISLYFKDPLLKKSLWISLKTKILSLAE
jgi:hypothetical protein